MIARSWLAKALRALLRREIGQVVPLAAGATVVILGIGALAVDIGAFARAKRDLQNDADAMALAGAQELPENALAQARALDWGANNGVEPSEVVSIDIDGTCDGDAQDNMIAVRLQRDQRTFLARVFGITSSTVETCATAGRFSVSAFTGAAPWGIEDECLWGGDGAPGGGDDIAIGETITLKYDADNTGEDCDANTGNFGALAIDDSGTGSPCGDEPADDEARKYGEAICWGAISRLEIGDYVMTEPGNIVSRTRDSVNYLFDNVSEECDEWDEVVDDESETLWDHCNPFSAYYVGGPSIVKLLPVLDGLWDEGGAHEVQIVSFIFAVLNPPPPGASWCTGSSCDITATFVAKATVPTGSKGDLTPNSSITTVALVE